MNNVSNKIKEVVKGFFKNHIYIMVLLFAIDMITKKVMENFLLSLPTHSYPVIEGFFSLTLVYNPGSFSGFLGNIPYGTFILMIASIVGGIGASIYLYKKFNSINIWMKIGLYLLIPGAFGNMVDRFLKVIGVQKGVIDFLDFKLPIIGDFPVFNFADICLTISLFILLIGYIILDYKNEKAKKEKVDE